MEVSTVRRQRVSFYTVGCRLNQAETALLRNGFRCAGYDVVSYGDETDVLVVNSCSVTEGAEADCRRVVRATLRHSPDALVAITGCYAQTGAKELGAIDGVDMIVGTQYKMQLPDYVTALAHAPKRRDADIIRSAAIDHANFRIDGVGDCEGTRANLKVQDGCQFMCAFCLIPFARGKERSRIVDDVLREAEALANRGHRELVVTGVNIGQYRDAGLDLVGLIEHVEQLDGIHRIRISSIEPTTIPDRLLEYLATSDKACRYLHVPIQSGDDAILASMNRRYCAADYRTFVEEAVRVVPGLCVGTDVMVGFPGEDERAFAETCAVVEDLPLAYLHVFRYSERPGTAASRLPHPVAARDIKTRSQVLAEISNRKRSAFYQREVGRCVSVLFEYQNDMGLWTGLTDHYIRVGIRSQEPLTNQVRDVRITGVADALALGTLLSDGDDAADSNSVPVQPHVMRHLSPLECGL